MTEQQIEQILECADWIWDEQVLSDEDVNKLLRFASAVIDTVAP